MKINTSPTDHVPVEQMQCMCFNGKAWERFGELQTGNWNPRNDGRRFIRSPCRRGPRRTLEYLRQAPRLFEVQRQFEDDRLLDGNLGRVGPLEYLVDVLCRLPGHRREAGPVAREAA
jgi:hypothetical protein